jgi:hypothetical protein
MEVYTTLLGVRTEINKILAEQKADSPLKGQLEKIEKCIHEMPPELAYSIYDRCERLKLDFDFLKNNFSDSLQIDVPENLTNRKHLSVFLMGESSSGKTTFIQRSLGQKAGEISSKPTTGFLTIHKLGNEESLEILFPEKFSPQDSTKFEKFLQKYHLSDHFKTLTSLELNQTDAGRKTLGPEFSTTNFSNFINEANDFPECFRELIWTHKKIGKNSSFFDFVDIYDMPGSGSGNEKHEENISYAFNTYRPDIVFYFIDSGKGIPSTDGIELFRNHLLKMIDKQEEDVPLLFFVYETPESDNMDKLVQLEENGKVTCKKDFIEGKANALYNYIINPHTNENGSQFSPNDQANLLEASLLDLRGPKNSVSESLQNALALSLQKYYLTKAKKAVIEIIDGLKQFENEIENNEIIKMVLNKMEDTGNTGINSYLKDIFDEIKQKTDIGKNLSIEDAKKIFLDHFYLTSYGDYKNSSFSQALFRRYDAINRVIDDIIKEFSKMDKTDNVKRNSGEKQIVKKNEEKINNIKTVAKTVKDRLGAQLEELKNPRKCISYQKIVDGFQKSYKDKVEWQDLPFKVQTYYALRFSETDDIKNYYLLPTASAFISRIKNDLESLESIRSEIPLCISLDDFVNHSNS